MAEREFKTIKESVFIFLLPLIFSELGIAVSVYKSATKQLVRTLAHQTLEI